jgi:hypothetical protein
MSSIAYEKRIKEELVIMGRAIVFDIFFCKLKKQNLLLCNTFLFPMKKP